MLKSRANLVVQPYGYLPPGAGIKGAAVDRPVDERVEGDQVVPPGRIEVLQEPDRVAGSAPIRLARGAAVAGALLAVAVAGTSRPVLPPVAVFAARFGFQTLLNRPPPRRSDPQRRAVRPSDAGRGARGAETASHAGHTD